MIRGSILIRDDTAILVSPEEIVSGQIMKRFPTGVSLVHATGSLADARRISDAYRKSAEG